MEEFYRYFPLIIAGSQIVLGWLLWSLKREFVSKEHCDKCQRQREENIKKLESRTQRIEDRIQNLPSTQSIHSLSLQMERMAGDIRSHTEILERVEQKVMRQEDFLHRGNK